MIIHISYQITCGWINKSKIRKYVIIVYVSRFEYVKRFTGQAIESVLVKVWRILHFLRFYCRNLWMQTTCNLFWTTKPTAVKLSGVSTITRYFYPSSYWSINFFWKSSVQQSNKLRFHFHSGRWPIELTTQRTVLKFQSYPWQYNSKEFIFIRRLLSALWL